MSFCKAEFYQNFNRAGNVNFLAGFAIVLSMEPGKNTYNNTKFPIGM
jgi:hypothetical protein